MGGQGNCDAKASEGWNDDDPSARSQRIVNGNVSRRKLSCVRDNDGSLSPCWSAYSQRHIPKLY